MTTMEEIRDADTDEGFKDRTMKYVLASSIILLSSALSFYILTQSHLK